MERILLVFSQDGKEEVAQVAERDRSRYSISTEDERVREAVQELIQRGRQNGLIYHHDHRQKTDKGAIFRMYGRWSKPGDPDFLDALTDGLIEFNYVAFTVEMVNA